jgi:hypothetical protein
MKANVVILSCGEEETFRLLQSVKEQVSNNEQIFDSIIILLDDSKPVLNTITRLKLELQDYNHQIVKNKFNGDFSEHRNVALKDIPEGNLVIWLDADEEINDNFLIVAYYVFKQNKDLDMAFVSRRNHVTGNLTQAHVNRWAWKVDEYGRINYPDFQGRLHLNKNNIKWSGKVHERLTNYKNYANFADELELIHIKDISRQEKQNELYDKL